nr:uroporphyrinogen-III synthase [Notoacmeibacter sp. MSK16QG-6]
MPGAERTARAIREHGHDAHLLPLTTISGLDADLPPAEGFDAVILTSANAIRHLPKAKASGLRHLPVWTVGSATANAARDRGFTHAEALGGDAETLTDTLIDRAPQRLLYLAGRVRRKHIEERLRQVGMEIVTREIYDTREKNIPDTDLNNLRAIPIDVVLLTSTLAARLFRALTEKERLGENAVRLCFSRRIADEAGGTCEIARNATEQAALTLLDEIARR